MTTDNKQITTIITPEHTFAGVINEIITFKDLFYFLAWKDFKVRYKQTLIGMSWAVVKPLLTMIIFTVVFGKLAKLPSGGVPYEVMVFAAMLPWYFFATILQDSSNAVIGNAGMISKIYFPRIILPLTSLLVNLLDFVVAFIILLLLMFWYQIFPDERALVLPLLLLWAAATSLGLGLWFSALIVKYRDFRYIIPFVVQLGLYISPVGFSISIIPEEWRLLYSINPMVGVIEGFRWCLLGQEFQLNTYYLAVSVFVSFILFISGFYFFQSVERKFADII